MQPRVPSSSSCLGSSSCLSSFKSRDDVEFRLHEAVANKKRELLERLLSEGAEIECTDRDGNTPLFAAAFSRNHGAVKVLLKYGANPNTRCRDGHTSVHGACFGASRRILRLILSVGGSMCMHDKAGRLPKDWCNLLRNDYNRRKMLNAIESFELHGISPSPETTRKCATLLAEMAFPTGASPSPDACVPPCLNILFGGSHLVFSQNVGVDVAALVSTAPEDGNTYRIGSLSEMVYATWRSTPVMVRRLVSSDHPQLDLVLTELDVLRSLRHPNLLYLVGVTAVEDKSIVAIFERAPLRSLHDFLHVDKRAFGDVRRDSAEIMRQLTEALAFLHSAGWLHCAVTSHAVQLLSTNCAKLSCFEYAVHESHPETERSWRFRNLVDHVALHRWLAPEVVVKRAPCSESSDVYSLCVVLAELMTGRLPWPAFEDRDVARAMTDPPDVCLPRVGPSFSRNLLDALRVGLKFDCKMRVLRAGDVLDLVRVLNEGLRTSVEEDVYDSVRVTSSSSASCSSLSSLTDDGGDDDNVTFRTANASLESTLQEGKSKRTQSTSELFYSLLNDSFAADRDEGGCEGPRPRSISQSIIYRNSKSSGPDLRVFVERSGSGSGSCSSRDTSASGEFVKPASHFSTRHGKSCSLSEPHLIGGPTSTCPGRFTVKRVDPSRPGTVIPVHAKDDVPPVRPPRRKKLDTMLRKVDGGAGDYKGPYRSLPRDILKVVLPNESYSSYHTPDNTLNDEVPEFEGPVPDVKPKSILVTRGPGIGKHPRNESNHPRVSNTRLDSDVADAVDPQRPAPPVRPVRVVSAVVHRGADEIESDEQGRNQRPCPVAAPDPDSSIDDSDDFEDGGGGNATAKRVMFVTADSGSSLEDVRQVDGRVAAPHQVASAGGSSKPQFFGGALEPGSDCRPGAAVADDEWFAGRGSVKALVCHYENGKEPPAGGENNRRHNLSVEFNPAKALSASTPVDSRASTSTSSANRSKDSGNSVKAEAQGAGSGAAKRAALRMNADNVRKKLRDDFYKLAFVDGSESFEDVLCSMRDAAAGTPVAASDRLPPETMVIRKRSPSKAYAETVVVNGAAEEDEVEGKIKTAAESAGSSCVEEEEQTWNSHSSRGPGSGCGSGALSDTGGRKKGRRPIENGGVPAIGWKDGIAALAGPRPAPEEREVRDFDGSATSDDVENEMDAGGRDDDDGASMWVTANGDAGRDRNRAAGAPDCGVVRAELRYVDCGKDGGSNNDNGNDNDDDDDDRDGDDSGIRTTPLGVFVGGALENANGFVGGGEGGGGRREDDREDGDEEKDQEQEQDSDALIPFVSVDGEDLQLIDAE